MSRVRIRHRAEKLFHALHAFCIKEQQHGVLFQIHLLLIMSLGKALSGTLAAGLLVASLG